MNVKCPRQYSVWENDKGGKIFVEEVYDESADFLLALDAMGAKDLE